MAIISMVMLCNATAITGYDRTRLGLSNEPLVMEHDNNGDHREIASHSSKHRLSIL